MVMDINSALVEIEAMEKKLAAIKHAAGILYYDGVTAAPRGSAAGRADTFAYLSEEDYKTFACERTGELLKFLSDNLTGLVFPISKKIELLKEKYDKLVNVPMDEYVEYDVLVNESQDVWRRCKEDNDYAYFGPYVDKIVDTLKRFAGYFDSKKDPYDVWLNEFERGGSVAMYDEYFAAVKSRLVPLIGEIAKCPPPDTSFLKGVFPVCKQRELTEDLMKFLLIDPDRCAIGETEHPFTSGMNYYDCRITTHYYEDNLLSSLYSVIHECGHAIYEMNMERSYYGNILSAGLSYGIHESQSRFYENIIGRSRAFSNFILPVIQNHFVGFSEVTPEMFYRAVNKAEPSLIRIEADELTYSMHIMIRYEIEKLLFKGDVSQKELPALWNTLYKEYLGIDVPNDTAGVLQDTHWGSGLFGYFPSYSIGSAYSAQMLYHIKKEFDINRLIETGNIEPVFVWLKERVYRHGASRDPAEIIQNCCNENFSSQYYVDYLEEKFRDIYQI